MLTTARIHRICTLAAAGCLALPAATHAQTVNFQTPGSTRWVVPANVTSASFEIVGAAGGRDRASGSSCTPGSGVSTAGTTSLIPGESLIISVGGKGGDASGNTGGSGGSPDGGPGGTVAPGRASAGGGGGGGSSSVSADPGEFAVISAGGGGCGGFASSAGGNGGGEGNSGFAGSGDGLGHNAGGGGAASHVPGTGGANVPADGTAGSAGTYGGGGAGAGSNQFAAGGGGGGGGDAGGGGGGAAAGGYGSGGGGGDGDSVVITNRDGNWDSGPQPSAGDGWVTITYTPAPAPVVTTGSVSAVGDAAATLAGTVNPGGIVTHYHFEYGTTTGYGQHTSDHSSSSSDAQSVNESLTGLAPNTLYHYRLVATNASGTTNGADQAFRTSGSPSAETGAASRIGETVATLGGTVDPNGRATSYHFEVGTTTAYGLQTPEASAGAGVSDQQVMATPTGLVPGTVYHYRLVATNASGTTDGADRILTTAAPSQNVGTGNVQLPVPAARAQRPALAVIGLPTVARGSVRVTLACRFAPCHAAAILTANVGRHARQTIGSSTARLRAGAHTMITIPLNAVGRRLLATHRRKAARVVLSLVSDSGSGGSRVVGSVPVVLGR